MRVIKEDPLIITAVHLTTNAENMAKLVQGGTSATSFPVTTKLSPDGRHLIVDGTLISQGFLRDGQTLTYTASCTGRIVYYFDEPLLDYDKKSREIYDQFIRPAYCVLSAKLQQLIISTGLIVNFPLAIPPVENVRLISDEKH